jgi:MFS family permease
MDRRGRRPGLVAGYVLLAVSGLVAFSATVLGSFTVLLVSGVMRGLGAGAALLGRAAVADMHPPSSGGALSAVWWWRERWARWEVLRWGARSTPSLTG